MSLKEAELNAVLNRRWAMPRVHSVTSGSPVQPAGSDFSLGLAVWKTQPDQDDASCFLL